MGTDEVLLDLLPNDGDINLKLNLDGTENGSGSGKVRSRYSGPNWDYEFDRLLKNEFGIKMTTQADLVALNQNLLDRNWMRYQKQKAVANQRLLEKETHEKKQRNGQKR